jgi:archaellum component FlaD/FlaE
MSQSLSAAAAAVTLTEDEEQEEQEEQEEEQEEEEEEEQEEEEEEKEEDKEEEEDDEDEEDEKDEEDEEKCSSVAHADSGAVVKMLGGCNNKGCSTSFCSPIVSPRPGSLALASEAGLQVSTPSTCASG